MKTFDTAARPARPSAASDHGGFDTGDMNDGALGLFAATDGDGGHTDLRPRTISTARTRRESDPARRLRQPFPDRSPLLPLPNASRGAERGARNGPAAPRRALSRRVLPFISRMGAISIVGRPEAPVDRIVVYNESSETNTKSARGPRGRWVGPGRANASLRRRAPMSARMNGPPANARLQHGIREGPAPTSTQCGLCGLDPAA